MKHKIYLNLLNNYQIVTLFKNKRFIYRYTLPLYTMKILTKKCKFCGKELTSMYQKQLDYNMKVHEMSCEIKRGETK